MGERIYLGKLFRDGAYTDERRWVRAEDYESLRTQMMEVNKALGIDRDNQDNLLRVKTALQLRAGITHEPEVVTRLPVPGTQMTRLSDIADELIRQLRKQGMVKMQAVFDGMRLRIDPWPDSQAASRDASPADLMKSGEIGSYTGWADVSEKSPSASQDATSQPAKCSFCGETKIHGPKCGYAGSPITPQRT